MFSNNKQSFAIPLGLLSDAKEEVESNLNRLPTNDDHINSELLIDPHQNEGQLAIDVVQTEEELLVIAPMAGTAPDNVSLHLQNDVLTIRGERQSPVGGAVEYFYEECYWGKFSRTIVLPVEVRQDMVRAEFKNGTLIVHLPKLKTQNNIPIYVVEE